MIRGELYDKTADVYSFGMTLLSMAVQEPLVDFLSARYCADFDEEESPRHMNRLIRLISEENWQPVDTGSNALIKAPPSINALIVSCCSPDTSRRPSFEAILEELSEICRLEVEESNDIQDDDISAIPKPLVFYRAPQILKSGLPPPSLSLLNLQERHQNHREKSNFDIDEVEVSFSHYEDTNGGFDTRISRALSSPNPLHRPVENESMLDI